MLTIPNNFCVPESLFKVESSTIKYQKSTSVAQVKVTLLKFLFQSELRLTFGLVVELCVNSNFKNFEFDFFLWIAVSHKLAAFAPLHANFNTVVWST